MNCRSCEIIEEMIDKQGVHSVENIDLHCPLCNYVGDSLIHPPQFGWQDTMSECQNCHNYILYSEDGLIWKDESYFDKIMVMRKLNNPKSIYVYFNNNLPVSYVQTMNKALANKTLISINGIIELTTADEMVKRLKTLVVFS